MLAGDELSGVGEPPEADSVEHAQGVEALLERAELGAGHHLGGMGQRRSRKQRVARYPAQAAERAILDQAELLGVQAPPLLGQLLPATARWVAHHRAGGIADPVARGAGAVRPFHILWNSHPESTDGFENGAATKQVGGHRKAFALHVGGVVEGEHALERLGRGKAGGFIHQDLHGAADEIVVLQRGHSLHQPVRLGLAIAVGEGEDLATGDRHATVARGPGAGLGRHRETRAASDRCFHRSLAAGRRVV